MILSNLNLALAAFGQEGAKSDKNTSIIFTCGPLWRGGGKGGGGGGGGLHITCFLCGRAA